MTKPMTDEQLKFLETLKPDPKIKGDTKFSIIQLCCKEIRRLQGELDRLRKSKGGEE